MTTSEEKIVVEPGAEDRTGHRIAINDLQAPVVQSIYRYWCDLRGDRSFPCRKQLAPKDIAGLLRNILLVRVIGDGNDFEYRVVGDAHVESHDYSFSNLRVSEVNTFAPGYGSAQARAYRWVYRHREPLALRGWIDRRGKDTKIIFHESVMLPLGPDDQTVDHLLIGSVYANTYRYGEV